MGDHIGLCQHRLIDHVTHHRWCLPIEADRLGQQTGQAHAVVLGPLKEGLPLPIGKECGRAWYAGDDQQRHEQEQPTA
jgi:hypothetical protein